MRVQYWKDKNLSVMPVDQLRRQLGVRFFSAWYYTRPEAGTLTKKEWL